ncbi:Basic helix-loop-helix domain-containing protein USF3 [Triplophysa tibetana]|uniref:N-alpha-acetyltransferase 50 n=1 Tax=Triplophysa tibetana TaxID=1572043 RepID=A0A5A9N6Z1_9TELE|nr:Basic helix-loop-helix domain-containing protein USF3 [Triplophysa tibetana]
MMFLANKPVYRTRELNSNSDILPGGATDVTARLFRYFLGKLLEKVHDTGLFIHLNDYYSSGFLELPGNHGRKKNNSGEVLNRHGFVVRSIFCSLVKVDKKQPPRTGVAKSSCTLYFHLSSHPATACPSGGVKHVTSSCSPGAVLKHVALYKYLRPKYTKRVLRIELGDVTPHNIKQLKRLNQVIFPVSYNDKFYKDVLEVGELAKLVGAVCCRVDHSQNQKRLYIMTLGCLAPYRRLGIANLGSNLGSEYKCIKFTKFFLNMTVADSRCPTWQTLELALFDVKALKQNMILAEAFRYIGELKRQNDEMLLNGAEEVQAEEIKRLRCQLEDLRKESAHYIELLKANGINFLDDPTIHWKGKQRCAKVAKLLTLINNQQMLPAKPLRLQPMPSLSSLPQVVITQLAHTQPTPTVVPHVHSSPQNNSHVVILQQGSSCPAPQVLREESQPPCQHIVIIQAPTPQSHHTAIVMQAAGAKQLVNILPRPSTQLQAQAPQTITVNGQVYVLQPAKSQDKGISQSGQCVTQVLQPACEESNSNVAMNCLGALTSLSHSISKVSSQSNLQIYTITPPSYTTVQPALPLCGSDVTPCVETVISPSVPVPSNAAGSEVKILPKKSSLTSGNQTRQSSVRRTRLVKRKERGQSMRRIAAKSKASVVNTTNSNNLGKDRVSQYMNTPDSVSSTSSGSAVISVSSSSEKPVVKPSVPDGDTSKTSKSVDIVPLCNSVMVSSVSSPTSFTQDFKLPDSNMNKQPGKDGQSNRVTEKVVTEVGAFAQKEMVAPQQECLLENDSFEPPQGPSRQTDSPLAGGSGGRGFSVASLLPSGHSISASSSTFGSFSFTSEQAEILAMAARAIFEQESPGKRTAVCSDNPTITAAAGWDLPKMLPNPSAKESINDHQVKLTEQPDLPMSKTSSQVPGRGAVIEPLVSGTTGIRHSQSIAYSQSQPSTITSLNVNNLIRPNTSQPYPGSPNLAQQVPVPSSGSSTIMVSQSSSQVPPTCSGLSQLNEYAPLKNALMRTHVGVGMSKRSAQDDLILPNKRSKLCPPGNVSRGDIKATDHVQMMVSQMPSSTSAIMTRNHSDGVGPLFSGNTLMSTILRPTDGQCYTLVPTHEQTQPSVVHLQQGHVQHNASQSGQNMGGNPYLKHQQQQEQRHLYQLQHHLTQPESQIHGIHQRTLLQDQHVHKKRGVVRAGQTGQVNLQKQHHLEKTGVQQHQQQQPPQQHQQQQPPQQHQQQQPPQQHQQQQPPQQHQQQQPPQQHQQQHQQQQSQQHQQQQQQQQQHHQQQQKAQQIQQQQQSHQQQQMPPQNSHSRHQHLQQQIQQQHFGSRQDKNCETQQTGQRGHQNQHLGQPERTPGQDHGPMQRLMGSRSVEQQLTSQASNSVSRSSDLACTPSRQERHRLSSYSAESLIGKTPATGEQRMGVHLQAPRNIQDQSELRGYVDSSRGKGNINHNSQNRLPPDHANNPDTQRIHDCGPFKALLSGHQMGNFEVQVSRSSDMSSKSVPQIQRGPQSQAGFRMGAGPTGDGRARGTYSGPHPAAQGLHIGAGLTRDQDGCHQSFMQSLLAPHIPEQTGHQRSAQGCTPTGIDYNCVPGTSAAELQAKSSSPNLHLAQKAPSIRLGDNNKGHHSQVSGNLHGPPIRAGPTHPPTSHSSSDTGRTQGSARSLSAISQRPHHIGPDPQSTKIRPGDRSRSSNLRPGNPFEPESSLPLPSGGGVLIGRTQTGSEARRSTIVRFMADGAQVSGENNFVSEQHLTQNFGFPFIADGGMNPPPPINANASFIPPVTQPSVSRTQALLPVEPQNTLPSFYPSYSPAHPSLPSEIPLQYFPNQMFTSPSTDKSATAPLNNRFGSILSPPRPVGFAQASFPLLTDITPMSIANSSGITPHLSNFNLTSLFPEIATAMPPDGSSMPMSPLLSLANTTSSDSNKQSNRPAHNIRHILGHDGTSAV